MKNITCLIALLAVCTLLSANNSDENNMNAYVTTVTRCIGAGAGTIVLFVSEKHFTGLEGRIISITAGTIAGMKVYELVLFFAAKSSNK